MKLSFIQLEGYALGDLTFQTNPEHKPEQAISYNPEDIVISHNCEKDSSDDCVWRVGLALRIQPRVEANAPYQISLTLSGLLRILQPAENKDSETVIRVNGASLLYGVAREVVRQVTSIGPYAPLLIPSVSFRPDQTIAPSLPLPVISDATN